MNDNALRLIGYLIKSHKPWDLYGYTFNTSPDDVRVYGHKHGNVISAAVISTNAILKMIGSQR